MFKQIHKISPFRASKKYVIPQKLAPTNSNDTTIAENNFQLNQQQQQQQNTMKETNELPFLSFFSIKICFWGKIDFLMIKKMHKFHEIAWYMYAT